MSPVRRLNNSLVVLLLVFVVAAFGHAQSNYYRYVNENGVKVINQSIPPRFAKNGYEIVNHSGMVVQVVPPAPKPEEVEAERTREALKQKYLMLVKRYSDIVDIEAARDRQFVQIDANISIQKGNLNSLRKQMNTITESAANYERSGRTVPEKILHNLNDLKSQVASVEELIVKRRTERNGVKLRFDKDILLFSKGQSLLDRNAPVDNDILRADILGEG